MGDNSPSKNSPGLETLILAINPIAFMLYTGNIPLNCNAKALSFNPLSTGPYQFSFVGRKIMPLLAARGLKTNLLLLAVLVLVIFRPL